jgi:hypothetical protein
VYTYYLLPAQTFSCSQLGRCLLLRWGAFILQSGHLLQGEAADTPVDDENVENENQPHKLSLQRSSQFVSKGLEAVTSMVCKE